MTPQNNPLDRKSLMEALPDNFTALPIPSSDQFLTTTGLVVEKEGIITDMGPAARQTLESLHWLPNWWHVESVPVFVLQYAHQVQSRGPWWLGSDSEDPNIEQVVRHLPSELENPQDPRAVALFRLHDALECRAPLRIIGALRSLGLAPQEIASAAEEADDPMFRTILRYLHALVAGSIGELRPDYMDDDVQWLVPVHDQPTWGFHVMDAVRALAELCPSDGALRWVEGWENSSEDRHE